MLDLNRIDFDKAEGLVPAVVQDAATRHVLMLGYMNRAAAEHTLTSGLVTFWSRSRDALWTKGETSGHTLRLVAMRADCDADALLVLAEPNGPTCHTGAVSCFGADEPLGVGIGALAELEQTIRQRLESGGEGSYVRSLAERGPDRIAQKVGEEAVEVVLASKSADDAALAGEAADLLFHLLVLLNHRGLGLEAVLGVLEERRR